MGLWNWIPVSLQRWVSGFLGVLLVVGAIYELWDSYRWFVMTFEAQNLMLQNYYMVASTRGTIFALALLALARILQAHYRSLPVSGPPHHSAVIDWFKRDKFF